MSLNANRLGEMLLEAGLIDQFQLESALSMQRNLGGRIGSALVKLGYLPEETIMEFLEAQSKFARVSLAEIDIPEELMLMIPYDRMLELMVVPFELRRDSGEKILRIAMTDPTNRKLVDDLQFTTGCKVIAVLAAEDDIGEALRNNMPQVDLSSPNEVEEEMTVLDNSVVDFSELPSNDPRLDRLLDVLKEKGILSVLDVERIKFD